MKRQYGWLAMLLLALTACTSNDRHFISDNDYRQQVNADFEAKIGLLGAQFYTPAEGISVKEQEALQFLYAYMLIADMTENSTDYYDNTAAIKEVVNFENGIF